jgi:Secretion system C-terminal sorting domain
VVSSPGNYSLTLTNANCCISTCCYTVFQTNTNACLISGPTTLVNGQPALLCVQNGYQKYLWSTGDTTSCILAKNLGWYAVTVTSLTGCVSTCSLQITDGKPGNCINASTNLLCQGQSALLCAPNASNTQYLWNTGSIQSCIAVNAKGIYTVTMTQNGVATVCQKTIVALQSPVCNITGNLSPEKGKSTQLCSADLAGKFQWSTGDTTSCITVSDSGTYALTITNANGCKSYCAVTVLYLLKANTGGDYATNRSGQLQINTYPNPFSDQAILEFQNNEANSHVAIELCQLTGRKLATLFDQEIEQNKKYQVTVNAENLPEGIYLCRFVNGDQVITKKLVRIR